MSHSLLFPHVQYSRLEATDVSKLEEDRTPSSQPEPQSRGVNVLLALEQLGYVNTTLFQFSVAFFILSQLYLQTQLHLLFLFFAIAFHLLAAVTCIIARCHEPDSQSYVDAAYNSIARRVIHRIVGGMTIGGACCLIASDVTFDHTILIQS